MIQQFNARRFNEQFKSFQRARQVETLIPGRFSVGPNPIFDSFFFFVLVGMMSLGVEPSQLDTSSIDPERVMVQP
jgi:hypothetical protein